MGVVSRIRLLLAGTVALAGLGAGSIGYAASAGDDATVANFAGLSPVAQPESLKKPDSRQAVADAVPDVMVVAAYGLILPQAVLDIPRLGCVNIHASLLPRWRGAAPIQRAIEAGDAETGITLMRMDAGLDTGAILGRYPIAIAPDDTAASLHDKLAELGAAAIASLLPRLTEASAAPQDDALADRTEWLEPASSR